MQEVEVYIEAAARALERAASRVSDSKLKDLLIQKASELRSLLSSTPTPTSGPETSIDRLLDEIRRLVQPRVESGPETREPFEPLKVLFGPFKLLEDLEERLKELDRMLSRLLP